MDNEQDLQMLKMLWLHRDLPRGFIPTLTALQWLIAHPKVAAVNADVPTLTQSKPAYPKGKPWLCGKCQKRAGQIVAGDLVLHCGGCGRKLKWYSRNPARKMSSVA